MVADGPVNRRRLRVLRPLILSQTRLPAGSQPAERTRVIAAIRSAVLPWVMGRRRSVTVRATRQRAGSPPSWRLYGSRTAGLSGVSPSPSPSLRPRVFATRVAVGESPARTSGESLQD